MAAAVSLPTSKNRLLNNPAQEKREPQLPFLFRKKTELNSGFDPFLTPSHETHQPKSSQHHGVGFCFGYGCNTFKMPITFHTIKRALFNLRRPIQLIMIGS